MKKLISFLVFIVIIILLTVCGTKKNSENSEATDSEALAIDQNDKKFQDSTLKKDAEFAAIAADNGLLEVQLGKLASTNASSPEVKKLGEMMVKDHGGANEELKGIALKKTITLPDLLSEQNQKKYDELAKKLGHEFDKDYSEAMVRGHKDNIDLFKKEADKGNDADLKAWASGKISTLEHHLMVAEETHKAVKKEK